MDTERERNDIDETAADEEAAAPPGLMGRLVEAARGSGVGTEDPNIVGDVGPADVAPGRDPEATILPGGVVDSADMDALTPAAELAGKNGVRHPNESDDYRRARQRLLVEEIELRRHAEQVASLRRDLPSGGRFQRTTASWPRTGRE